MKTLIDEMALAGLNAARRYNGKKPVKKTGLDAGFVSDQCLLAMTEAMAQAALEVVERLVLDAARHPSVAEAISNTPWQPSVGSLYVRYGEIAIKAAWQQAKGGV
jgi:hypothetical protein